MSDRQYWPLYLQVSRKYKTSTEMLEEKQEELKVQKDEIKLLRLTVESYDSKVTEQTQLINKLERELTNVKGMLCYRETVIGYKGALNSSLTRGNYIIIHVLC